MAQDTFAARLARERQRVGMSKYALAEASGLDAAYIGRLESGAGNNPGLKALLALAQALGCTVDTLVWETSVQKR